MHLERVVVKAVNIFKVEIPKEVIDFLPELVAATRQEDGCISYVPHLPLDDSAKIYFHEVWENQDAVDKHLATDHLKKFREMTAPHLEDTRDVSLWRVML